MEVVTWIDCYLIITNASCGAFLYLKYGYQFGFYFFSWYCFTIRKKLKIFFEKIPSVLMVTCPGRVIICSRLNDLILGQANSTTIMVFLFTLININYFLIHNVQKTFKKIKGKFEYYSLWPSKQSFASVFYLQNIYCIKVSLLQHNFCNNFTKSKQTML